MIVTSVFSKTQFALSCFHKLRNALRIDWLFKHRALIFWPLYVIPYLQFLSVLVSRRILLRGGRPYLVQNPKSLVPEGNLL